MAAVAANPHRVEGGTGRWNARLFLHYHPAQGSKGWLFMRNLVLKRLVRGATAFAAVSLFSPTAFAGIYADDATRCLVKSMTAEDQLVLVKWVFASMSLHPAIKQYSG